MKTWLLLACCVTALYAANAERADDCSGAPVTPALKPRECSMHLPHNLAQLPSCSSSHSTQGALTTSQVRLGMQVVLRANASDGAAQTFYGLPGLFGAVLPRTPNTTLRLAVAQPETGCGTAPAPAQHGPHTALLAMRGSCSFADKAAHAQAAGATLLIVYDVQPGAPIASCISLAVPAAGACLTIHGRQVLAVLRPHAWPPPQAAS